MIKLNEIYAAHQGEGRFIGRPSVFVRTHLCPVKCRWCDTPFTWDKTESGSNIDASDLIAKIVKDYEGIKHIVWTGGEPLIHKEIPYAIRKLNELGYTSEIETSAAVLPANVDEWISCGAYFNLSPKLSSASPEIAASADILSRLYKFTDSVFKVVIENDEDLEELLELLQEIECVRKQDVYLMPCGTTRAQITNGLKMLMPKAMRLGFNITTRMHITAYGEMRGT